MCVCVICDVCDVCMMPESVCISLHVFDMCVCCMAVHDVYARVQCIYV